MDAQLRYFLCKCRERCFEVVGEVLGICHPLKSRRDTALRKALRKEGLALLLNNVSIVSM